MAFVSRHCGRVLIVQWQTTPTLADVAEVDTLIASTRREAGAQLVYVAVIPSDVREHPSLEVRQAFTAGLPRVASACDSVHIVIEGSDLQHALLRGVIRAMNVLSRVTRGMKIHSTLDAAFRDAFAVAPEDVQAARVAISLPP